jgi:alpha-L-arabinofuranosidase
LWRQRTEPNGRLTLKFIGKGVLDIDVVSLFPQDTWKNRPGGLRADLVQLLADMKPGFIRFPEGVSLKDFTSTHGINGKKQSAIPNKES